MTDRLERGAASAPRIEALPLMLVPSGYQLLSLAASIGMTLLTITAVS